MSGSGRGKETAVRYTSDIRLTYDDYCRMPSGHRYELVEGDIRMVPSPTTFHQRVSRNIQYRLLRWVEERGLGEVYDAPLDVVLSQHNVVQPDILFVARERLGIITEDNIQGAPDLVIEILSKSTEEWDRVTKRAVYSKYGVRELWFVDPWSRTIEVACHTGNELATVQVYKRDTTVRSRLLDGFHLDVDEIFK
ncbi:MAG: Uma2 family endonuclease [Firmicutes bacterium]|nr:Uma2 family endonuclease [Bacillota bacterium]